MIDPRWDAIVRALMAEQQTPGMQMAGGQPQFDSWNSGMPTGTLNGGNDTVIPQGGSIYDLFPQQHRPGYAPHPLPPRRPAWG
jgi:hypothetical protein